MPRRHPIPIMLKQRILNLRMTHLSSHREIKPMRTHIPSNLRRSLPISLSRNHKTLPKLRRPRHLHKGLPLADISPKSPNSKTLKNRTHRSIHRKRIHLPRHTTRLPHPNRKHKPIRNTTPHQRSMITRLRPIKKQHNILTIHQLPRRISQRSPLLQRHPRILRNSRLIQIKTPRHRSRHRRRPNLLTNRPHINPRHRIINKPQTIRQRNLTRPRIIRQHRTRRRHPRIIQRTPSPRNKTPLLLITPILKRQLSNRITPRNPRITRLNHPSPRLSSITPQRMPHIHPTRRRRPMLRLIRNNKRRLKTLRRRRRRRQQLNLPTIRSINIRLPTIQIILPCQLSPLIRHPTQHTHRHTSLRHRRSRQLHQRQPHRNTKTTPRQTIIQPTKPSRPQQLKQTQRSRKRRLPRPLRQLPRPTTKHPRPIPTHRIKPHQKQSLIQRTLKRPTSKRPRRHTQLLTHPRQSPKPQRQLRQPRRQRHTTLTRSQPSLNPTITSTL